MSDYHETLIYFLEGKNWLECIDELILSFEQCGFELTKKKYKDEKWCFSYNGQKGLGYRGENNIHLKELEFAESICLSFMNERLIEVDMTYRPESNEWSMTLNKNLAPQVCYDGIITNEYYSDDLIFVYNFIKHLHIVLDSQLTIGSEQRNYCGFDEQEGSIFGCDSIFRFDRNGRCLLVRPFEERRPIISEDLYSIDGKKDCKLSTDSPYELYYNWHMHSHKPVPITPSEEFRQQIN